MMTDEEELAVGPKNKKEDEDPPLCKRIKSMALMSIKQKEEEESHLEAPAMSMKNDDPKVTAMSVLEMTSIKLPSSPEETIGNIKHQLRKGIRQFGRKYERVFKVLEVLQPLEVRKQMVEFAIKEAARFKRRHLIQQLEKILEEIHSEQLLNKDNRTPNI